MDGPELLGQPRASEVLGAQGKNGNTILQDHLQRFFVIHFGVGRGHFLLSALKLERLAKPCLRYDVKGKRAEVISTFVYSLSRGPIAEHVLCHRYAFGPDNQVVLVVEGRGRDPAVLLPLSTMASRYVWTENIKYCCRNMSMVGGP